MNTEFRIDKCILILSPILVCEADISSHILQMEMLRSKKDLVFGQGSSS